MIEQSKYLPKQMNGPVVNSVMAGLEDRLYDAKKICEYLYGLSIDTAQETELENIGCLVGYPRPLVPEGFEDETEGGFFIFTTLPMVQDVATGFSEIDSEVGGQFSTIARSKTGYMALGLYRKFLDKVAYIKRYGITLYSVDMIAKLFTIDYTITYDDAQNIVLTFNSNIGYKNVWILTNLFNRLATIPQVLVISQTEGE